jgi:hypothetical protein
MLPRLILLQVEGITFIAGPGQSGSPNFKLSFIGGAGQILAQYPASGYRGGAVYGREYKPSGGLFQQLFVANDVGGAYLHVVAHDENNPPDVTCRAVPGAHGSEQVCFSSDPMELYWGMSVGGGQFQRFNEQSRVMDGQKFQEHFSLRFLVWGDPPILVGGRPMDRKGREGREALTGAKEA